MRKLWGWLVLGVLAAGPLMVVAQSEMHEMDGAVPRNIHWGLDLLRKDSYEEAERQILAGSRIQVDGGLASGFRSCREQSGQFQGFYVVSSQAITPRLRVLYIALEYEKMPFFLKLTVYRTPDGWVVLRSPLWVIEGDSFESMLMNREPGTSLQ
jgi:hypothetical protein